MSQRKSGYDPYVFFDYQGERLTYQDIEIRYAISRQSLMYRINVMGLSVQAAIELPNRRAKQLHYRGQDYNQQTLAEKAGIDVRTLRNRLKAGWSIVDAVELPVGIRYDSFSKE